jgi:diguanylate cyclase (GGDEF)-like protein
LKFLTHHADELVIKVFPKSIDPSEMIKIIDYLCTLPKTDLMGMGIISLILVGYANHHAGLEISASIFYLLPVALVSWCAGRREGGFIALASSVAWYVADWGAGREYSHPIIYYWNMAVMFGFFFIMSFTLSGLKEALEEEKKLARVDSLTGVANPRYFGELATREIERCRRYKHPLTLLYMDCDNFKAVNDRFGHQTGNQLLRRVATALRNNTRITDIVARMGGDEFAVLMPETGEQFVPKALERLRTRLVEDLQKGGFSVTLSMGAAVYLFPPESTDEVIRSADRLMFLAKNQGKNRTQYQVFDLPHIDAGSTPSGGPPSACEQSPAAPFLPAGPGELLPGTPLKTAISPPA